MKARPTEEPLPQEESAVTAALDFCAYRPSLDKVVSLIIKFVIQVYKY